MPADRVSTTAPDSQGSDSLIDLWLAWWRILGLKAPLSGDVLQHLVDPSLLRDNAQLGVLNISAMQSPDPALERRIITEVASYGRQLGRLVEAVDVLARRQERVGMSVDDQRALDQLQDLAQQIAAAKTKETAGRIDQLLADVRELRKDPETNAAALDLLREALAGREVPSGASRAS